MEKLARQIIVCMFLLFATVACNSEKQSVESVDNSENATTEGVSQNSTEQSVDDSFTDLTQDNAFATPASTSRFLQQTTFGATSDQLESLTGTSASKWFVEQLEAKPSLKMSAVSEFTNEQDDFNALFVESTSIGFWRDAITANDQLRQRVAFALSEILVVSNAGGDELTDIPAAVANYQDILIKHAFGNYRTLIEAVTYSPAMGAYLSYLGNQKGDELTGRMPDENYAREILQLFTLGLVALNDDGTKKLDDAGKPIELYDNSDITGLARVFTGLILDENNAEELGQEEFAIPMIADPMRHSTKPKRFLGFTIPSNTGPYQSISSALDHIFSHSNLGPFITKQLIQRLVTSNPSSAYVSRVTSSFESGSYLLPDGTHVGKGERGDLAATVAAIIFDEEARQPQTDHYGKLREPILRFTQWARAFNVKNITPQYQELLWDTRSASTLNQHPYRSTSVFNFFRPGYSAPGTQVSQNGLVAPEFQITNATSIPGYINFMTYFIFGYQQDIDVNDLQDFYDEENIPLDASYATDSFLAEYEHELTLVEEPEALLEHLSLILIAKPLSKETAQEITQILASLPAHSEQDRLIQVQLAILLVMTSPEYLIQR